MWKVLIYHFYSNGIEVTVVYFRSGYEPGQYLSDDDWNARLLVERSLAIKCPSINYHLAGTKKVQQALAKPGMLKRFITDDIKIKTISDIFTGLYSMDSNTEDGQKAFGMVLIDPSKYEYKELTKYLITFNVNVDFFSNIDLY